MAGNTGESSSPPPRRACQSSRSVSHATKYRRQPSWTSWCGPGADGRRTGVVPVGEVAPNVDDFPVNFKRSRLRSSNAHRTRAARSRHHRPDAQQAHPSRAARPTWSTRGIEPTTVDGGHMALDVNEAAAVKRASNALTRSPPCLQGESLAGERVAGPPQPSHRPRRSSSASSCARAPGAGRLAGPGSARSARPGAGDRTFQARKPLSAVAGSPEGGAEGGQCIQSAPPVHRLFGEPHLPDRGVDVAQLAQADAAGLVSDRRGELRRSAREQPSRVGNPIMRTRQSLRQQIPRRRHLDTPPGLSTQ
ncbi:hypothetical protein EV648_1265 [Kribbella sp. VKM Ac-2568]|nr:hypothetical protein EV648_1265 [Kribbella sp. VKM Ac-2568]